MNIDEKTVPFRTRYEQHVVGGFGEKAAKGSRKMVTSIAQHPLDAVVHEVLLMHSLPSP